MHSYGFDRRWYMLRRIALLSCIVLICLGLWTIWDQAADYILRAGSYSISRQAHTAQDTLKATEQKQANIRQQVRLMETRLIDELVRRNNPRIRTFEATLTFYTSGPESTGKRPGHPAYGITASGHRLKPTDAMLTVAADPQYYSFGQRILIDGIGTAVVMDTGGDIKGPDRFDIYAGEDVPKAIQLGRQVRRPSWTKRKEGKPEKVAFFPSVELYSLALHMGQRFAHDSD